jgi:hypothetical protein
MRMIDVPESGNWPEPPAEEGAVKPDRRYLLGAIVPALAGMVVGGLVMGYMASIGMGPWEERWATKEWEILEGAVVGGFLGFIGFGAIGGLLALLIAEAHEAWGHKRKGPRAG